MQVTLPVVVYTFCVVGTVGVVTSVWKHSPNYISPDGYLLSTQRVEFHYERTKRARVRACVGGCVRVCLRGRPCVCVRVC